MILAARHHILAAAAGLAVAGCTRDPTMVSEGGAFAAAVAAVAQRTEEPFGHETRLWLYAGPEDPGSPEPLSEELAAEIARAFPRAASGPVESAGLFLCAPGERVGMPGHGCPIADDGRIVLVGWFPEASEGDRKVYVGVITTSCEGRCTWMEDWELTLLEENGDWTLKRAARVGIT